MKTKVQIRTAYELFRRRPVKHRLQSSTYFHADTFARVFTAND